MSGAIMKIVRFAASFLREANPTSSATSEASEEESEPTAWLACGIRTTEHVAFGDSESRPAVLMSGAN